MSTPPRAVPLDTYWGIIQSGARARLTTAQLWSAVRHSTDRAGETLSPGSFTRMNQLRGLAGSQLRADRALARLTPDQALTGDHIALDINSRDQAQRNLGRRYRVGFDVEGTHIPTGAKVSIRLTDTFGANLPATLGELIDTLGVEAPALAQDSEVILENITGNLSIREV